MADAGADPDASACLGQHRWSKQGHLRAAWFEPVPDISEFLRNVPDTASIALLPDGPQAIPYLRRHEGNACYAGARTIRPLNYLS